MSDSGKTDLIKTIIEGTEDVDSINSLTEKIIGSAFSVANTLGTGFLEKVYENALSYELRSLGVEVKQQLPIRVEYKSHVVGEFVADLLVDDKVIVELKAVSSLDKLHSAQCLNYLRATGHKICLLLNFGRPRIEIRRLIL